MPEVIKELKMLSTSLIKRMRLDLTTIVDEAGDAIPASANGKPSVQHRESLPSRRWVARPRSLRLSTRPRPPLGPDGTRSRSFARISKSCNMPYFVFNVATDVECLSEKLVDEVLILLFRRLHPEKAGWNLSLMNLCATNMSLNASDGRGGAGRDIGRMFRRQEDVLKDWEVDDIDVVPDEERPGKSITDNTVYGHDASDVSFGIKPLEGQSHSTNIGSEDHIVLTQTSVKDENGWDSGDDGADMGDKCKICGAIMPAFAMIAHGRFHAMHE